jgi:hypothetical protein
LIFKTSSFSSSFLGGAPRTVPEEGGGTGAGTVAGQMMEHKEARTLGVTSYMEHVKGI